MKVVKPYRPWRTSGGVTHDSYVHASGVAEGEVRAIAYLTGNEHVE